MKKQRLIRWMVLLLGLMIGIHPMISQAQTKVGSPAVKVMKNKVEYEVVSFGRLFFSYQPPFDVEHPDGNVTKGSGKKMPIPAEIMALNGKKVAIEGYMLPLDSNGKNVKSFLLADSLVTCLFCSMMGYDQWMMGTVVDPKGFAVSAEQEDESMTIYGTLEVGEEMQEGQLVSLYRIKADAYKSNQKKLLGIF